MVEDTPQPLQAQKAGPFSQPSFIDDLYGGGAAYMKYDGRSGVYKQIGDDEKTFNGHEFVGDIFNAKGGYAHFEKDQPPEKHFGNIFPKDEAPARSSLGHTDKGEWTKGKFSDELEDYYRPMIELPLRHKETGEQYIFTATNRNALAAIKDLLGQCRRCQTATCRPSGSTPRHSRASSVPSRSLY
jgi:hypothetical protein